MVKENGDNFIDFILSCPPYLHIQKESLKGLLTV